jgi:hypothetical protein
MIHPFLLVMGATALMFAPIINTTISTTHDALQISRATVTKTTLFQTAQILGAEGTVNIATETISLPAPAAGNALPNDFSGPQNDSWGQPLLYCKSSSQAAPDLALAIVSAGPDLIRQTSCTDALQATTSGDDIAVTLTHGDLNAWAAKTQKRHIFLSEIEALQCDSPHVVSYNAGIWQCTDIHSLISLKLDGSESACPIPNGTGVQNWDGPNKQWGACVLSACDAGYSPYQNECYPSAQSCSVANGGGQRTFSTTTGQYSSCTATVCNTGYSLTNGQCQTVGLTVGSCYAITCTSLMGNTKTLYGSARDSEYINALAPSGLSTWLLRVNMNNAGEWTVTSWNCFSNWAAAVYGYSGGVTSVCSEYGIKEDFWGNGHLTSYTWGSYNHFQSCTMPVRC